jgi:uncharacterized protein involved in exopolysaccharide biosynthesis
MAIADTNAAFTIPVTILNEKEFKLSENGPAVFFDQPFEISAGRFLITKTSIDYRSFGSNQFFISHVSPEQRAVELVSGLTASQSGESNNIMQLTFYTENGKAGVDIVNRWMKEYQQAGLEDKRQIAMNALRFIDDQMDTVRQNLSGVEKNLQGYREKNKIYSPQTQSANYFSSIADLDNLITRKEVQLENISYLIKYISDPKNPNRQVASVLNISEPSLTSQIVDFNDLQLQRATTLKTTTAENPLVRNLDATIEKLRANIIQNLENVKQSYALEIKNFQEKSDEADKQVSLIPLKKKQLLDISRRQKILEELFSFLLQKSWKHLSASASTISNVK